MDELTKKIIKRNDKFQDLITEAIYLLTIPHQNEELEKWLREAREMIK